ncbi:MAG: pyridoxine 5'-phosphate synthase [Hyphomicrobiales bacterium]
MSNPQSIPYLRLGVNIDHVATIRNARGGRHPDPVRAALVAADAGAEGLTAHLREDRRHISDFDIARLRQEVPLPLNLEMAATDEMLEIALAHVPNACCIVPEKREEVTTEGGLDVAGGHNHLKHYVEEIRAKNIRVSLFIDPDKRQVDAAAEIGADIVELHTGAYCEAHEAREMHLGDKELQRIRDMVEYGDGLGLEMHAGHGLTFETVEDVAEIPQLHELNIGHFLIGEAIYMGLPTAIRKMRNHMDVARKKAGRAA